MWRFPSISLRKDKCRQTGAVLSAYLDQQLGLQERTEVDRHLKACQGCREELESLRATVQLLRRVPQASPSRSFAVTEARPLPRWSPFPVLRTVTAVVAAFLVLVFAADMVNLFEGGITSTEQPGASSYGPGSGDDDAGSSLSRQRAGVTLENGSGEKNGTEGDGGGEEGADNTYLGETLGESQAGWLRPLEYGLLAVVVSGGVAMVFWWGERRKGVVRIKRWK